MASKSDLIARSGGSSEIELFVFHDCHELDKDEEFVQFSFFGCMFF